jgi:acyl-CoA hydrolase
MQDTGVSGDVHGGVVLRMCDEVAALAGMRYAGAPVLTAAIDELVFLGPIRVGDRVTVHAAVNAVWQRSAEIVVQATAEDPLSGESRQVLTGFFTMVAPDKHVRMPRLSDRSEGTDQDSAEVRRRARLAIRARSENNTDAPSSVDASRDADGASG